MLLKDKKTGREIVELEFRQFKTKQYCDKCDYPAIYIVKDYKKDKNYNDENRYAILKTCEQHKEQFWIITK